MFKGGPSISVIFGPGGPNIEGVQISRDSTRGEIPIKAHSPLGAFRC